MNVANIDLLFRLIAAHLIADFFLQPPKWVEHKHKWKIKSKYLYFHILITGLLTYIAMGSTTSLLIPSVITIFHFVFDLSKLYFKKGNNYIFILDQGFHLAVIFCCWLIYSDQLATFYQVAKNLYYNRIVWLYITSYLAITFPVAILMNRLTEQWNKQMNEKNGESLKNAGKWIGIIERILVLTFTISGQFEAIGFLLAAKSVFRFGDLRDSKDRKRTEYILIGTFLSFAISIALGLVLFQISKYL